MEKKSKEQILIDNIDPKFIWQDSGGSVIDNAPLIEIFPALEVYASQVLAEREANNGWISVKDTLPEPRTNVLATYNYGKGPKFRIARLFNDKKTWDIGTVTVGFDFITHWQPLPTPPNK